MGSLHEEFGTLPPAPDRRIKPRTTPASLKQVNLGNGRSGIVLNISEAGMAVAVAHVLAVGEHLAGINFLLPASGSGSMQSVEISVEIVWLSESKKGAGMQFVGLSADTRNRISNWIARERTAPEFEHLPKPVHRDRQHMQINSGRSRATLSRESIAAEEAGSRYAKMFPSENANPRITATLDEIKNEEDPQTKAVAGGVEEKISGLPAKVSMVSMANTIPMLAATSAQEGGKRTASAPIQTANRDRREPLIPDKSETQAADSQIEVSPSSPDGSSSNFDPPEKSSEKGFKLQFAIFGFVLVAISFILGLTAGYAPIEKRLRSIGRPARPPATTPSAPPAVLGEATPPAPAGEMLHATPTEAPSLDKEASHPENRPAPSHSLSSNSAAHPSPAPSLPSTSPPSTTTRLKDHHETNPKSTTTPAESSAVASSKNPPPSPKIESKEPKPKAESKNPEERSDSTSQLSVLISPDARFIAGDHETARLQAGDVITYVVPHQPRPGDRYNSTETVKVRATIGSDGRVKDVKPINGPIFLLTSVVSAVRQWRFRPTLLNGSPVQAQDDVTIEFRLQR